jgi:2'-5' RNA ligase
VPRGTCHLTLAFLGDVADEDVVHCRQALDVIAGAHAFEMTLGGPRILYARKSPRLVKVDVLDGAEGVRTIQEILCGEISSRISGLDLRPKPPHATLARFRKNARRDEGARVEEALMRHEALWAGRTDRFVSACLVKSTLTPSGPVYESLEEVALLDPTESA